MSQNLLWQMITRVELEYKHVIHARGSPAVNIDSHEKEELYHEKWPTINPT